MSENFWDTDENYTVLTLPLILPKIPNDDVINMSENFNTIKELLAETLPTPYSSAKEQSHLTKSENNNKKHFIAFCQLIGYLKIFRSLTLHRQPLFSACI